MNEISFHSVVLILPLIISNVMHMLIVKHNYFNFLNIPINSRSFGRNKTYRGFVVLLLINGILLYFSNFIFNTHLSYPFGIGAILGLTYMIFELPNSLIKRRLGIAPGEKHKRFEIGFKLIDKMDSAFGVVLIYWIMGFVDPAMALFLFLISSFTHILFSQLLYLLKIKKSF
jgi:hypothetical protein